MSAESNVAMIYVDAPPAEAGNYWLPSREDMETEVIAEMNEAGLWLFMGQQAIISSKGMQKASKFCHIKIPTAKELFDARKEAG